MISRDTSTSQSIYKWRLESEKHHIQTYVLQWLIWKRTVENGFDRAEINKYTTKSKRSSTADVTEAKFY